MGWKTSIIIIENPDNFKDELTLLKAIGKGDFRFQEEITFEECIYPNDESINIGYYNGNIIISDDYQVSTGILDETNGLNLTNEEKYLCELFPKSEIITVACHSVVNYHGYSLIKNGEKLRFKMITSDTPLIEFGKKTIEEEKIYSTSYQKQGANYWKDDDDEFAEDQLMEEFTFGMAKRRLGVFIDQEEGNDLLENLTFNKYVKK